MGNELKNLILNMKKLFLLFLIFGFHNPAYSEKYPIHKYTCPESQGECTEAKEQQLN